MCQTMSIVMRRTTDNQLKTIETQYTTILKRCRSHIKWFTAIWGPEVKKHKWGNIVNTYFNVTCLRDAKTQCKQRVVATDPCTTLRR